MKWDIPPIIKVYEALGAVADGRVVEDGETAKVFSSSGNKFYEVNYDESTNSIMTNDNGSYWKGYLGYPAIAYLMQIGKLSYREDLGELMKGIHWKDINQEFKNDFEKTIKYVLSPLSLDESSLLEEYAEGVLEEIKTMELNYLGPKKLPPEGY